MEEPRTVYIGSTKVNIPSWYTDEDAEKAVALAEEEMRREIALGRAQKNSTLDELTVVQLEDGNDDLVAVYKPPQFQRIRRITGYLVGTLDRFNNAKRAEEHDRVKHGLRQEPMRRSA